MRSQRTWIAAAFLAFVSLASSPLTAQTLRADVDEFGTQDGNDLWIPAAQFMPLSGQTWITNDALGYFTSSAGADGAFEAYLPLPQGAYLDSWRVFFFDGSASNGIAIVLRKQFDDTTNPPTPGYRDNGFFSSNGTPGYNSVRVDENQTIDLREPFNGNITRAQAADYYVFRMRMAADANLAFKGVRVIWHRQVSPAPATATFNDVPVSDPAFQYIEALVASGVTAGCNTSPPMYCPDATLTRRQMAVFLAKALGLHWPNF